VRTFVAPIGTGFGDVLISLPVIQCLIDRNESVFLVSRCFRQVGIAERVVGLCGEVAEDRLELQQGDRYVNLRDHWLQTDHIWGSPEFERLFGKTDLEQIIKTIAADFDIQIDYSELRQLQFATRAELSGAVAFVPGTDGFYKHWPHEHWLCLYELLKAEQTRVILVGRPDESPAVQRLLAAGIEWIETRSPGDAIDVISSCAAVVAVDTGLMHTAVQQGIPTFAFIHPRNYHMRSARNCCNFIANDCPAKCGRDFEVKEGFAAASGLGVDLKFDHRECTLSAAENCMGSVAPQAVLDRMREYGVIAQLASSN
jgi:hypothetical protein